MARPGIHSDAGQASWKAERSLEPRVQGGTQCTNKSLKTIIYVPATVFISHKDPSTGPWRLTLPRPSKARRLNPQAVPRQLGCTCCHGRALEGTGSLQQVRDRFKATFLTLYLHFTPTDITGCLPVTQGYTGSRGQSFGS